MSVSSSFCVQISPLCVNSFVVGCPSELWLTCVDVLLLDKCYQRYCTCVNTLPEIRTTTQHISSDTTLTNNMIRVFWNVNKYQNCLISSGKNCEICWSLASALASVPSPSLRIPILTECSPFILQGTSWCFFNKKTKVFPKNLWQYDYVSLSQQKKEAHPLERW